MLKKISLKKIICPCSHFYAKFYAKVCVCVCVCVCAQWVIHGYFNTIIPLWVSFYQNKQMIESKMQKFSYDIIYSYLSHRIMDSFPWIIK